MRFQATCYVVFAVLVAISQAQGVNVKCYCAVGSKPGEYCGYCREVAACHGQGNCYEHRFLCASNGDCAPYGQYHNCTLPRDQVHCGPEGPSPLTTLHTSHSKTTSPGPTGTSAPSQESGANDDTGSSSLSTGAKAGIGVGVAVGVILIAGLTIWFLLKRRRSNKSQEQPQNGLNPGVVEMRRPESPMEKSPGAETHDGTLVGTPVDVKGQQFPEKQESAILDGSPVAELHPQQDGALSELHPQHGRSELP